MEKTKLMSLLSKLENVKDSSQSDENQDFVNLSDSFAMKLMGGYGDTNAACQGNGGCSNNESCSGNNGCSANASCSGNNTCHTNEGC